VIFSIALLPTVGEFVFLSGAKLPDPDGLLTGSGKQARHIVLKNEAYFDDPRN